MLESCKDAQERWGGVHQIIDKWLKERQEMLVLFCGINTLKTFTPRETPLNVKIQAFCQVLMDYCSAGHFEVYIQLMQEAKDFEDEKGIRLLERATPILQLNTEECVNFNDKYQSAEDCLENLTELPQDLSHLGELLEQRFQVEDELIEVIHNNHREQVA